MNFKFKPCKMLLILSFFSNIFVMTGRAQSNANEYFKTAIKVSNFSDIDFTRFEGAPKPKKDSASKTDSLSKVISILLDSIKKANVKIVPFDCKNAEATKPLLIGSLNKIDTRVFDVTNSSNINLSLFGVVGNRAKNSVLMQANFMVYKDYPCDTGTTRVMVGMTMYLYITNVNTKVGVNLNSLPNISASVQLGLSSATYHLHFDGLTQTIDFKDLPDIGNLNIDSYTKIVSAWSKILEAINKDSPVDPIVIPNYKDVGMGN
jgi:hypothetical protein